MVNVHVLSLGCPGSLRRQDISSHDIDLDKPSQLGPRTLKFNVLYSSDVSNI